MANDISNSLVIMGNKEEVKEVLDFIKGDGYNQFIDFNKIHPHPESLKDPGKINTWRIINWSTSVNCYDQCEIKNGVSFETSWSEAYSVIKKLSELYPKLSFKLYYDGCLDAGREDGLHTFKNGEEK